MCEITETENEIKYEGDLILTKDFNSKKNLVVKGNIRGKGGKKYYIHAMDIHAKNIDAKGIDAMNIKAWDIRARVIDALNIDAMNIYARVIICKKRIKKTKEDKTIAYSLTENRYEREKKEQMQE